MFSFIFCSYLILLTKLSLIIHIQPNLSFIKLLELGAIMKEAYYFGYLVLTLFILVFLLKSNNQPKKYQILTLIFQQIIIVGFFSFVIFTSNPFNYIFPAPVRGFGIKPNITRSSFGNSSTNFIFRLRRFFNYFFISFSSDKS